MKNLSFYLCYILPALAFTACKSYSKYTIDKQPIVKLDTSLFGIWKLDKADEQRLPKSIEYDKKDFILIQSRRDLFEGSIRWAKASDKEKIAALPLDRQTDTFLISHMLKTKHDTNQIKREYQKEKNCYNITQFNNKGTNPHYQQWTSFLSEVNSVRFINIPYRYVPGFDDDKPKTDPKVEGYFFVRIISMSSKSLVTAVVADPTLKNLKSSAAVRERIAKNINDPRFYSDTLHFYKVSDYHESLNEAMKRANP